jgi:cardiolipin synthase
VTARDIPNLITAARMLLVVPVAWAIAGAHYGAALLLFAGAGFSDALDGYLAKRFSWESHLGALLDPIADKLMLVTAYAMLGWKGLVPYWLVAAVILRDLVIVGGACAYQLLIAPVEGEPNLLSKVNTLAQIVLVLAVVADRAIPSAPGWVLRPLVWVVAVTTIASGATYVWVWGRRALAVRRRGPGVSDPRK